MNHFLHAGIAPYIGEVYGGVFDFQHIGATDEIGFEFLHGVQINALMFLELRRMICFVHNHIGLVQRQTGSSESQRIDFLPRQSEARFLR